MNVPSNFDLATPIFKLRNKRLGFVWIVKDILIERFYLFVSPKKPATINIHKYLGIGFW